MITDKEYSALAKQFGYPLARIKAIDFVEGSGFGFDPKTKKMLIQFEPGYFRRISRLITGFWALNKVDVQTKEWLAFNDAFSKNPTAAMESTSIGRMQVMGENWKVLGFKSVGDMWEFAKKSEVNQLWLGLKFISTKPLLHKAVLTGEYKNIAYYYNGKNYWIKGYDKKLASAELKFK